MNSYLLSVLKKCAASCLSGLLIISSLTICTFILLSFLISRKNMNLLRVVIQRILKGYAKVIILLTLNRLRTIIKCVVLGVLFTCVLIGLSSAPIFAASEDSPSSEVSSWLAPDLDSVQAKSLAEQMSEKAAAVEYTTTDIYNLLYNAMRGEVYNSTYSLPRIASYTDRIAQILYGSGQSVPSQSLYANLREIHEILNGLNSGVYVRPDIQSSLFRTDSSGNFVTLSDDSGSILEMTELSYAVLNQLHGDLQNNSYYLSQLVSSYDWQTFSSSYSGTSLGYNNSYLSSNQQGTEFYVFFSLNNQYSTFPNVLRIFVPLYSNWNGYSGRPIFDSVEFIYPNNIVARSSDFEYFLEPTQSGSYIYLFDFNQRATGSFCVHIKSSGNLMFRSDFSGSLSYISFNTDEYQQMKQAFYQAMSANAQGSMASDVSRLAQYLADPDKIAAEEASQQVIDDTLDGFTGNGSAAAKTSDTGSMKNMSGSIQSGLNSGASASNAASVFSNQTFWSWFTQATSNGINNPYPAPVVQNTRGSGDFVPDFLSGNQAELNDLLNQRNSW